MLQVWEQWLAVTLIQSSTEKLYFKHDFVTAGDFLTFQTLAYNFIIYLLYDYGNFPAN